VFQLELKTKSYILRTKHISEAEKWIQTLKLIRDEAKNDTIMEDAPLSEHEIKVEETTSPMNTTSNPVNPPPPLALSGVKNIDSIKGESHNNGTSNSESTSQGRKNPCCVIL
jgi:hypothetical protein